MERSGRIVLTSGSKAADSLWVCKCIRGRLGTPKETIMSISSLCKDFVWYH